MHRERVPVQTYIRKELENVNLVKIKIEVIKSVNWQHQLLTVMTRIPLLIVYPILTKMSIPNHHSRTVPVCYKPSLDLFCNLYYIRFSSVVCD